MEKQKKKKKSSFSCSVDGDVCSWPYRVNDCTTLHDILHFRAAILVLEQDVSKQIPSVGDE